MNTFSNTRQNRIQDLHFQPSGDYLDIIIHKSMVSFIILTQNNKILLF